MIAMIVQPFTPLISTTEAPSLPINRPRNSGLRASKIILLSSQFTTSLIKRSIGKLGRSFSGNLLDVSFLIFNIPGPFQGGGYRAAAPGFYQRNNANPSYQERRQSMEETLSKFMSESVQRHEENSNMIKEIRASTGSLPYETKELRLKLWRFKSGK
ncbi:hypothetical protein Tco_1011214 [Tanacetum coccineum]